MKYSLALALTVVCSLAIAACASDPATSPTTTNGSVSATVNDAAWAATTVQATWTNNVLGLGGSQIQGSANRQINISGLVSATGTYQLSPFSGLVAAYTEGSGTSVKIFSATGGTLVVEKLTSTGASGTFTFEAKDSQGGTETRSVKSGKFDVKF